MRGADNDDVAGDDRCRVQADLAVLGIDRLIVVHLQIDNAAGAKRRDAVARLRVERHHLIARA